MRSIFRTFSVLTLSLLVVAVSSCASADARQRPIRDYQTEHMLFQMVTQAKVLMDSEKHLQAKALMERAAMYDRSSYSGIIHSYLAHCYRNLGNPEKSVYEAELALRYDPSRKDLPYLIALCYKDQGKFDEAIAWLNRFLQSPTAGARKSAEHLLLDLQADKEKMAKYDPNAPDYLDDLLAEKDLRHWPQERFPLKVHIEDGRGVKGYRPSFSQYIVEALDTWNKASGGKLGYKLVENPSEADLRVRWTSDPVTIMENNRERGEAGITRLQSEVSDEPVPKIVSAEILIGTVASWYGKGVVDEEEVKGTCIHEVGHAMGISGHSRNVNDIMYFGRSARQMNALTKRDKSTIARLYYQYPVISPVTAEEGLHSTEASQLGRQMPSEAFAPPLGQSHVHQSQPPDSPRSQQAHQYSSAQQYPQAQTSQQYPTSQAPQQYYANQAPQQYCTSQASQQYPTSQAPQQYYANQAPQQYPNTHMQQQYSVPPPNMVPASAVQGFSTQQYTGQHQLPYPAQPFPQQAYPSQQYAQQPGFPQSHPHTAPYAQPQSINRQGMYPAQPYVLQTPPGHPAQQPGVQPYPTPQMYPAPVSYPVAPQGPAQ
ncbi:MAG TPA: matrixin family metalloprotease [Candidatus Obscuribacterales bacterium]